LDNKKGKEEEAFLCDRVADNTGRMVKQLIPPCGIGKA